MEWEQDPAVISAACNIIRTLQELKTNPRTHSSANLLRVNGPGTVIWRIRYTKMKSGYWSTVVYPKADTSCPLYSIKKVRAYLTSEHNIRPADLPGAETGLQTEEEEDTVLQQVPRPSHCLHSSFLCTHPFASGPRYARLSHSPVVPCTLHTPFVSNGGTGESGRFVRRRSLSFPSACKPFALPPPLGSGPRHARRSHFQAVPRTLHTHVSPDRFEARFAQVQAFLIDDEDENESGMDVDGMRIAQDVFRPRDYSSDEETRVRMIQLKYRAYRMLKANSENIKLAEEVRAARAALETLLAQKEESDTSLVRFKNLFASSDRPIFPDSSYILTTFDSRPFRPRDPGETLYAFVTVHTQSTRESVAAIAKEAVDACVSLNDPYKSISYLCAKAIFRTPHYPLIVGMLPFPDGLRKFVFAGTEFHVRVKFFDKEGTGYLFAEHLAGLKKRFNPAWALHVEDLVVDRDVATLDFYTDSSFLEPTWVGSLILSKFLCRKEGLLVPAISIESMVARETRSGAGNAMYYYISELLFADSVNIEYGYIFAQCLNIPFYTFKMSVDNVGKCLVFQLTNLFAGYELERECTVRCHTLYAPLSSAGIVEQCSSPAKRIRVDVA